MKELWIRLENCGYDCPFCRNYDAYIDKPMCWNGCGKQIPKEKLNNGFPDFCPLLDIIQEKE
jgi:organic radical activating enzyme